MSPLTIDLINDAELHHRVYSDCEFRPDSRESTRVGQHPPGWLEGNPIRELVETARFASDRLQEIVELSKRPHDADPDDCHRLLDEIHRLACSVTGDAHSD
jgi:hypothetical protein